MAQQLLIDIGMNDELRDVIRKANHNFKSISANITKQAKARSRDIEDDVEQAINEVNQRIDNEEQARENAVRNEAFARETADQDIINSLNSLISSALLDRYPVGSIYLSVGTSDPADFIGGTWNQINDTFLVGKGSMFPTATGQIDAGGPSDPTTDISIPWLSVHVWVRIA